MHSPPSRRTNVANTRRTKAYLKQTGPPLCELDNSSENADGGESLLCKARAIKQFLKCQRGRVRVAAGKAAWTAMARELERDRVTAEEQLIDSLEKPPPDCCPSLAATMRLHAQQFAADVAAAASTRTQLFHQQRELACAVQTLRLPPPGCTPERMSEAKAKVQAAMRTFTTGLQQEIERLSTEAQELSASLESILVASAANNDALVVPEFKSQTGDPQQPLERFLGDGGAETAGVCSREGSAVVSSSADCAESLQRDGEARAEGSKVEQPSHAGSLVSCSLSERYEAQETESSADAANDELEALIRQHPLAPLASAEGLRGAWRALAAAHAESMQEVAAAMEEATSGGKHGGWTADDHALFITSFKHTRDQAAARGGGVSAVLDHLAMLLPHKNKLELQQHMEWHTKLCSARYRKRAALAAFQRQRQGFLSDAARLLSEALELAAADSAADTLKWGATGDEKRAVVAVWQEQMEGQRQEEAERAAAEEAQAAAVRAEDAKKLGAQRAREREAVQQHRERRAAEAAARLEQQQRVSAAAARVAAVAIASCRPAVAARQAAALARFVELQEVRARHEIAAMEAAARLDASVPHPTAPADPMRPLRPTECSVIAPQPEGRAFAPVYGYSTDQVAADRRFRVLEALGAVGLRGTRSAAEALAGMAPVRGTRVDAMTSNERRADRG